MRAGSEASVGAHRPAIEPRKALVLDEFWTPTLLTERNDAGGRASRGAVAAMNGREKSHSAIAAKKKEEGEVHRVPTPPRSRFARRARKLAGFRGFTGERIGRRSPSLLGRFCLPARRSSVDAAAPARLQLRIPIWTRPVCSTKRMSRCWFTVSKNFSMSASSIQLTFLDLIPTTSESIASSAGYSRCHRS
jgi:hypothetical protein